MNKVGMSVIILCCIIFLFFRFGFTYGELTNFDEKHIVLENLTGMNINEVQDYLTRINVKLEIEYEYSSSVDENIIISQGTVERNLISGEELVKVVVSKGNIPFSIYREYGVNELGRVPIMMYHGIVNIKSSETLYVGGNVDEGGYNRTAEAFRDDLDFYYKNGYRMIRLSDYVDGVIDVELGKSPIILTFDDGNVNNFNVMGIDSNGELIIDPNCAVGILEEYKRKYPDYGVTATFFVNGGLFEQKEYDEKILKWLVLHGYDIGNHTLSHVDFTKVSFDEAVKEVGNIYRILNDIIPKQYVEIVALPFGSPYKREHVNYGAILNGEVNGYLYHTEAVLRVGWEAEVSCFSKEFNPTFLKRIRAYDNNGEEFDIEMNFRLLEENRYISDGDVNTIVVLDLDVDKVIGQNREIIGY